MRPGIDSTWTDALEAAGIRTAIAAWLDFASGPVAIWTGENGIYVTGTGDTALDGLTFQPLIDGLMIDVGSNTFSYSGSEALTVSLGIPDSPTTAELNSTIDPSEYQTRTAIFWRAVQVTPTSGTTPASWSFRRVRAGSMDELKITNDGTHHFFTMTIEGHAAMISSATASTYLDQPKFDAADTSQAYAVSIANNPKSPSLASTGSTGGASSGGLGFNPSSPIGDGFNIP